MVEQDHNKLVLLRLRSLIISIQADWHHKALPGGEYAKTIKELCEAYPSLLETYDIQIGISKYTGEKSVLVRGKQAHALTEKRNG